VVRRDAGRCAAALMGETDVAIVGAGYTGLSAGIELLRAGRSVTILEAARLGEGASSRNAGMCGDLLKPRYGALCAAHGERLATDLCCEARDALTSFAPFLKEYGLSCDFERSGRLTGALSEAQLQGIARESRRSAGHSELPDIYGEYSSRSGQEFRFWICDPAGADLASTDSKARARPARRTQKWAAPEKAGHFIAHQLRSRLPPVTGGPPCPTRRGVPALRPSHAASPGRRSV
jgi:glycine/D-amino acid oxidase-like deaminating enzyme